ncbi:complement factor I isoform X2 [Pseudophryne corroboree]|uniref:complement factor I isoform X2 n=1 Tax=Pseudophryne corroboree TaxID=495146 RepID=UPI003081F8EE
MRTSSLIWFLLSIFSVCVLTSTVQKNTCWDEKHTSDSCYKVFCNPWKRCYNGKCICKLPYQCPKNKTFDPCTDAGKMYLTFCQLKSAECSNQGIRFSSDSCTGKFEISLKNKTGVRTRKSGLVKVILPNQQQESFVCFETWTITEANVACRQLGYSKGASNEKLKNTFQGDENTQCLKVTCRGSESTLAECTLRKSKSSENKRAYVSCYDDKTECQEDQFTCVNEKCIAMSDTCNGENDCGDLSDELCCKVCQKGFHCKSDTCIPSSYVCNGEMDCLSGEDEYNCTGDDSSKPKVITTRGEDSENNDDNEESNAVNYDIEAERKLIRDVLPNLNCGVAQDIHGQKRVKRIIGGQKAEKNQFPWQVAIKDSGKINCGGIYIGGCWVLTAAHCVRADQPQRYRIIIELLDRLHLDANIDSFPVKTVKVHEFYNPSTYENDIALLEVVNIYKAPKCMQYENNLVTACVPWSPHQFKVGETCVVSGWGREEGLSKVFHLKWGNITLMDNCAEVYKERFLDKMECAGTYDGSIDACKGDSGGPLVCFDANKVAYVWGVVSWGESCGEAGFPGVYTKVAHYFEWISRHVGRALISKYNI